MPQFVHNRTGRIIDVSEGIASRYRNTTRWTETGTQTPSAGGLEVPDGTVAEILAWVGARRDRRDAAITAENNGKQRKSLIAKLEAL